MVLLLLPRPVLRLDVGVVLAAPLFNLLLVLLVGSAVLRGARAVMVAVLGLVVGLVVARGAGCRAAAAAASVVAPRLVVAVGVAPLVELVAAAAFDLEVGRLAHLWRT